MAQENIYFILIQLLSELSKTFHPERPWILFIFCLSQLFLVECSNNFFTIEITNHKCPWYSVFYVLDQRDFLRPIRRIVLCKNIFLIWNSHMITNFEFRNFVITLNIIFNIHPRLNISRFHFNCFMMFLLYSQLFYSIYRCKHFWYHSHLILFNFVLQSSDKTLSNNRRSFFVSQIHFNFIVMQPRLHWSIVKLTALIYTYLVWFVTGLFKLFCPLTGQPTHSHKYQ